MFTKIITPTTTALSRERFAERYLRKDARTMALRLTYGHQSNKTQEVTVPPNANDLRLDDQESYHEMRSKVLYCLRESGWSPERQGKILDDLNALRNPKGAKAREEAA